MRKKKQIIIIFTAILWVAVFGILFLWNKDKTQNPPEGAANQIEKTQVRGNSMEPVLKDGETIAIDNNYYQKNEIKRDDIVIVSFSWREEPLAKFIRAIPGDTLALEEQADGSFHIIVNSEVIKNSEAKPYGLTYAKSRMINLYAQEYKEKYDSKIPDDLYLVLGNQTNGTQDSTQFGLVSREHILGKIVSE